LGGSYGNPFEQMCAYREKVRSSFASAPELARNDLTHVNGLVLFTQPVELLENSADRLGPRVDKWFHVADWTGAVHVLRNAASPRIMLPAEVLDELVSDLKALPF